MLQKFIQAAAIAVLFTATAAQAQYNTQSGGNNSGGADLGANLLPDSRRRLTPEEAQRERDIEARYNQTVNEKIPDKKASNDPWGNVRPAPAASSAGKQQRH